MKRSDRLALALAGCLAALFGLVPGAANNSCA